MARKHGPWTIEGTALKYQDPYIAVSEDQVLKPNGKPGTYATVKMKPGVSVLPLDRDGFVYLTRQFRYAIGKESIEAACGAVDGDERPLEAAKREAHEELGVEADEWIALGSVDLDTSTICCPVYLFLAKGLRFTESDQDDTEDIETVKITLNESARMVMESKITHGPSCVLILKAYASLKGAL